MGPGLGVLLLRCVLLGEGPSVMAKSTGFGLVLPWLEF